MNKTGVILSFLSLLSALFFNEVNVRTLHREFKDAVRNDATIITNDDASYLSPPLNYLAGNGWRSNEVGTAALVFRTPGYGLIYLLCNAIGGENALKLLKYLQLLLFAVSVFFLYKSILMLTTNKRLATIGALIYGLLPFSHGFLYYTLTEGITPALVIFYCYFLIAFQVRKTFNYLLSAAALFSLLILIRPPLTVLYIALIPFLVQYITLNQTKRIKALLVVPAISFCLIAGWQVRNYIVSGKMWNLHEVYFPDNNSIFRPEHAAIGDFYKSWGSTGENFHSSIVPIYSAAINNDSSKKHINAAIDKISENVVHIIGRAHLEKSFLLYHQCVIEQKPFVMENKPMPASISFAEEKCIKAFEACEEKVITADFFHAKIIVPLKAYVRLIAHSNLSLHIFQHEWRGKLLMEILRWICALLHVLIFTGFLFFLFQKKDALFALFFLSPVLYLVYLCAVQVMVEERYTLPFLPLMIMGTVYLLHLKSEKFPK